MTQSDIDGMLDANIFRLHEKCPGYFYSPEAYGRIRSHESFDNLHQMKKKLVAKFNKEFGGEDTVGIYSTDKYLLLCCKYKNCPYRYWYNCTDKLE